MTLLEKIRRLTPRQFENLVYDALVLSGMRNAAWRTPGPDAGRDIDGVVLTVDLSEALTAERWYVECKRYSGVLDWPTVYQKLSYADAHEADFLLVVTTGTLSPRCKEEISKRETAKRVPRIRYWDSTMIEAVVARFPLLLHKYRLRPELPSVQLALSPVTMMALKTIQAAYGAATLRSQPDPALECGAALVELLLDAQSRHDEGIPSRRRIDHRDLYPWCRVGGTIRFAGITSCSLRALLSSVRFLTAADRILITRPQANVYQFALPGGADMRLDSRSARVLLAHIAVLTGVELSFGKSSLTIAVREAREQ